MALLVTLCSLPLSPVYLNRTKMRQLLLYLTVPAVVWGFFLIK